MRRAFLNAVEIYEFHKDENGELKTYTSKVGKKKKVRIRKASDAKTDRVKIGEDTIKHGVNNRDGDDLDDHDDNGRKKSKGVRNKTGNENDNSSEGGSDGEDGEITEATQLIEGDQVAKVLNNAVYVPNKPHIDTTGYN